MRRRHLYWLTYLVAGRYAQPPETGSWGRQHSKLTWTWLFEYIALESNGSQNSGRQSALQTAQAVSAYHICHLETRQLGKQDIKTNLSSHIPTSRIRPAVFLSTPVRRGETGCGLGEPSCAQPAAARCLGQHEPQLHWGTPAPNGRLPTAPAAAVQPRLALPSAYHTHL